MDKLQLTGQNLGRVFNFRSVHLHVAHLWRYQVKLLNLKLKTRPKQLLGSLPLQSTKVRQFCLTLVGTTFNTADSLKVVFQD